MWKNLTFSWPAVGASVVFTGAVLGGYAFYVHAVELPARELAEQQRALAAQIRDQAVQRDVETVGNAILNTMALMQTTQAVTPMAMAGGTSDSAVAAAYGEPGPAVQPAQAPGYIPVPVPAPAMGYYADMAPPVPPPPPLYTPPPAPEPRAAPEAPGIVTVTVAPPPPINETVPQVLTTGFHWSPGYWNYNQGRFNWKQGQVEPTPAAYISSSSLYMPTEWVVRNGAYTLIPGHWVNPPPNSIPKNTLPGAAPLITVTTSNRPGNRPGGG